MNRDFLTVIISAAVLLAALAILLNRAEDRAPPCYGEQHPPYCTNGTAP